MYIPKTVPIYTCPQCGKEFICGNAQEWCYRKQWYNKLYICCSWTCFRKVEKEMESRQTKRGRRKKSDVCENQTADGNSNSSD